MEKLTNREKTDAVVEAYTARKKAREIYAELAAAGDEDARRKLEKADRELELLKEEDWRLQVERMGGSDPLLQEAGRRRAAEQHTRAIEAEFHQELARLGHANDHAPAQLRRIEEEALGYVGSRYGEAAADRCRGLLAPEEPASPLDDLESVPVLP